MTVALLQSYMHWQRFENRRRQMTSYDTIIRNATIIDGTGTPGFSGDLAIAAQLVVRQ